MLTSPEALLAGADLSMVMIALCVALVMDALGTDEVPKHLWRYAVVVMRVVRKCMPSYSMHPGTALHSHQCKYSDVVNSLSFSLRFILKQMESV